jgi:chromosome segregation ATPase
MDIELRLRKLEARYRAVLSAASAAHAHYRALAGESNATAEAIERANARWNELEARKRSIVDRIDALEDAESA